MKSLIVNGTELWYADRGVGTPLVFVHGFPFDHTIWAGQISGFAENQCEMLVGEAFWAAPMMPEGVEPPQVRIIVPDLRGFGRSRPMPDKKVTMEQFADDLAGMLDGLGISEPVVLCGMSMGGYIAFQFWRKHAERLRGLILCDTKAAADSPEIAASRRETAARVLREGPAAMVEGMMPRLFSKATRRHNPEMVEGLRTVMLAADPHGVAAALYGMAERPDMTASLGRIHCPTLVLVGQEDLISPPADMQTMADAIPGAKFVEIPGAAHMAPLESPPDVNGAIAEFLATL